MANGNGNGNAIDAILDRRREQLTGQPEEPEVGDAIDAIFAKHSLGVQFGEPIRPKPGFGELFISGAKEQIVAPFRIFGVEPEVQETEGLAEAVAKGAGSLVGIGVGFVPFLGVSSLALRSVGAFGRLPPLAQRLATSSTAFGLFEAGTSEEISEVPEEFAKGAAFGLGADLAFIGVTKAIGKAYRAVRPLPPAPPDLDLINPDALALLKQIYPNQGDDFTTVARKISEITDVDLQLEDLIARTLDIYKTPGYYTLPGIQNPEVMEAAFKRQLKKPLIVRHKDKATDLYKLLVVEEESLTARQVELLKLKFGELSFDEASKIIMEGLKPTGKLIINHPSGDVKFVPVGDVPEIYLKTPPYAVHHFNLVQDLVKQGKITENMAALSLGTHEYTHFITTRVAAKKFGITLQEAAVKLFDDIKYVLDDFLPDDLKGTLSADLNGFSKADLIEIFNGTKGSQLDRELLRLSVKVEKDFNYGTFEKTIDKFISTSGGGWYEQQGKKYFLSSHELLARVVEAMTYDPSTARKIAPNLTAAFEKMIAQESPHLERLLEGAWASKVGKILKDMWVRQGTRTRQFDSFPIAFGKKPKGSNAQGQFRQYGHFKGEGVQSPDGEWWEITRFERASKDKNVLKALNERKDRWGRDVQAGEDYAVLRHQRSGREAFASFDGFSSPTLANFVQSNQALRNRAVAAMSNPLKEAIVTLRIPEEEAVRKAIIDLTDYVRTSSLTRYWKDNLRELKEFAQQNWERYKELFEYVPRGKNQPLEDILGTDRLGAVHLRHDLIASYLQSQGKKGLVINEDLGKAIDKQFISLLVADQKSVQLSPEVISMKMAEVETAGMAIDGKFREGAENLIRFVSLSNESRLNSIAANIGVDTRDMAYFKHLVNGVTTDELVKGMDESVLATLKVAEDALQKYGSGSTAEDVLAKQGLNLAQDPNGTWLVTDKDGLLLAAAHNKQELETMALKAAAPNATKALDLGAQVPSELMPGYAGNGTAPKFMEQVPLEKSAGWTDRFRLFGATITAFENVALSAEKAGFGPTWTRIFHPLQLGIENVDRFIFQVPREQLGNMPYAEYIKRHIEKIAVNLPTERQHLAVNLVEYVTAEEIAKPGGFLAKRGMNALELAGSKRIVELGTAHDIPRLLSVKRLGQRLLKNRKEFEDKALQMINDPQARPETVETLKKILAESEPFNTLDDVYKAAGLSEAQKETLAILGQGGNLDEFSSMVVMRHSQADKLEPGFKSGWEQFVARHNMSKEEQQLATNLDNLLKSVFEVSGLDSKRQIKAYWPHLRQLMPFGIDLSDNLYRKELPEFRKWAHSKILTGELDPYSLDPVMVPLKYIRSLAMNKYVEPLLPDAAAIVKGIGRGTHGIGDIRVARLMNAYIDEIVGKPHATFEAFNQLGRTFLKTFNAPKKLQHDSRFIESLTNAMVSLFASATIPFRAGLLVRNYYQVPTMVPSLTGWGPFWKAVQRSIGWDGQKFNRDLMKGVFDDAIRAGAVQKHIIPLESSTEIFSTEKNLFLRMGGKHRRLAKVRRGFRYLVDKGFAFYQSADDWGRAVAFDAQRIRIKQFENQLRTGKLDWERFLDKTGMRQYEDVEMEWFERLYRNGQEQQAIEFAGRQAARKTIFRYGHANHPAGWNSVPGRLFGQFGTWPVQYKDFVISGMSRGTTADKVNFAATQLATNGAVLAGGAALGLNLTSWLTFPSLMYTGGPAVDIAGDLIKVISGSESERRMAYQSLKYAVWPLEDGRSLFVPGSYFIGDLVDAYETGNIVEAFGFNLARPDSDTHWTEKLFLGRQ